MDLHIGRLSLHSCQFLWCVSISHSKRSSILSRCKHAFRNCLLPPCMFSTQWKCSNLSAVKCISELVWRRNNKCIITIEANYYWLCCLLASSWTYGRKLVFLPYVRLINCRFLLFRSSYSSFSSYIFFWFSNQGAVLFFFLLLSLPSSTLQWHHEEDNFFSEYDQPIGFSTWVLRWYSDYQYILLLLTMGNSIPERASVKGEIKIKKWNFSYFCVFFEITM